MASASGVSCERSTSARLICSASVCASSRSSSAPISTRSRPSCLPDAGLLQQRLGNLAGADLALGYEQVAELGPVLGVPER